MSLIEEALRKVQEKIPDPATANSKEQAIRPAVAPEASVQSTAVPRPNTKTFGFLPALFIGLGFVLLILIIGWEVWSLNELKKTPLTLAGQSTVQQLRTSRTSKEPFELSGVIEGSGEPYAIINDRIVRIGEEIDGATLLEIGKDSALIKWRGKPIELKTVR